MAFHVSHLKHTMSVGMTLSVKSSITQFLFVLLISSQLPAFYATVLAF
jgi:hypothetical protein